MNVKLGEILSEYKEKNTDNKYKPVAVGRYGIRTRESIYSKELAKDYSKNKVIYKDTLTVGMGSTQIDIGILSADEMYSVSPAYHTFNIENINSDYLRYCLENRSQDMSVRFLMASCRQGKTVDLKRWLEYEITMYCMDKQLEIVKKIDHASKLIDFCKRELEKLDLLVKSRFIEMFGDPVANPGKWDIVTLDHCLENIDNGRSFVCDGNARTGDNPAILKLSAATYGVYKPNENKAIINVEDFVESAEVHAGDLLFTRKNTPDLVGMAAYVASTPKKLMMPDLIFRLNTKDICNKIFLWQLINHDLFRGRIQSIASGSAKSMSNISKERLGKMMLYLPPIDLQTQFADFVHQVDKSKHSEWMEVAA